MDMYNDMLGTVSTSLTHERLPDQRMIGTCSAHVLRNFRRRRSYDTATPPACACSALHRLKAPGAFVRRRLLAIHDHPRPASYTKQSDRGWSWTGPGVWRCNTEVGGRGGCLIERQRMLSVKRLVKEWVESGVKEDEGICVYNSCSVLTRLRERNSVEIGNGS